MRRNTRVVTLLSLFLIGFTSASVAATHHAAPRAASSESKSKNARDGWPDTRTASVSRQWVEAFNQGEDAMRAYLRANLSEASLAEKSLSQRVQTYRENRDRFGTLMLARVDKSKPGELSVTLMAADATQHHFVFKVATRPPYRLISVGRLETRPGGHFGFGH